MRLVTLVILLSGCYDPRYSDGDPAPFTCNAGACPEGYRCISTGNAGQGNAQALCIANGQPDPPLLIATTGIDTAPPQLLWDGHDFSFFFEQNDVLSAEAPGIYRMPTTLPLKAELFVKGNSTDIVARTRFAAFYQPATSRFVLAISTNGLTSSSVGVYSRDSTLAPVMRNYFREESASVLGFTAPSVVRRSDNEVTVAYTFAQPPAQSGDEAAVIGDNGVCVVLDPSKITPVWNASSVDTSCTPSPSTQTHGAFISDVLLSELNPMPAASVTLVNVVWTAPAGSFMTTILYGQSVTVQRGPFAIADALRVDRLIGAEQGFALVSESVAGGELQYQLALGSLLGRGDLGGLPMNNAVTFWKGAASPDVIGQRTQFILCTVDKNADDGLEDLNLWTFSSPGLEASPTSPMKIPRLSRGEIESCRLALDPTTGSVGVAWRERVGVATGKSYFRLLKAAVPVAAHD